MFAGFKKQNFKNTNNVIKNLKDLECAASCEVLYVISTCKETLSRDAI